MSKGHLLDYHGRGWTARTGRDVDGTDGTGRDVDGRDGTGRGRTRRDVDGTDGRGPLDQQPVGRSGDTSWKRAAAVGQRPISAASKFNGLCIAQGYHQG